MTNISIHHYIKDSTKQQRYNRKFKRDKNKSWTQVYREKHSEYSDYKSKIDNAHFICWDGEGIDLPDGRQVYALLMNNEGLKIVNPQGLSTDECLELLTSSREDNKAIHVCFGASYDVNMILRDIPLKKLYYLHKGRKIDYKQYQLEYIPRKSFTIKIYKDVNNKFSTDDKGNRVGNYEYSITLWDVFGFFQCSFIEALNNYFVSGNSSYQEAEKYKLLIEKIREGKVRRGSFTKEELEFVVSYCKLEVDALEQLMQKLRLHMIEVDMKVKRWDGAGACAASLLDKYKVKNFMEKMPSDVTIACEHAYYGGRIETLMYGNYEGTVYHYDINSAYPSVMKDLPTLIGKWEHIVDNITIETIYTLNQLSVLLVSWKMPQYSRICPFPYRYKGTVYFPPVGKSWVWLPEVLVAIECFHTIKITIHEIYTFYPSNEDKPFRFIPDLFEYRKELKKKGSGAEKVIKLGINSLYGKTVQSKGYDSKSGKKPPYHNLAWGGYITSATRAKLVKAAMNSPDSIIMLATDGIYSTKPLDLPLSNKLGEWEYTEHDYITVVVSGVYWYDTKGKETSYSRGFDKFTLERERIIEAWKNNMSSLPCKSTRFVTLGSAISIGFEHWLTWRTIDRVLALNMETVSKRENFKDSEFKPYKELVPTYAATPPILLFNPDKLSEKYKFDWDDFIDGINSREYVEECVVSRC
jgi:hypothetical protein